MHLFPKSFLILVLCASCRSPLRETLPLATAGLEREYLEYVPAGLATQALAPLLLVFHGGGGNAQKSRAGFGFEPLADEHGFLIAYPNAIEGHWNDGRGGEKFAEQDARVDDVAYVMALIADMSRRHEVDASRVYAFGASNGGMFVQRLAIDETETFAAVASVIAAIPEPLGKGFHPKAPLSVLYMSGTEDPVVPYAGGEVVVDFFPRLKSWRKQASRGHVLGVERSAALWAAHNGLGAEPIVDGLPDTDTADDARAVRLRWAGAADGPSVVLYKVIGGGHTLPGGKQYLSKRIVGNTCGDFDMAAAVWAFLQGKRRLSSAPI